MQNNQIKEFYNQRIQERYKNDYEFRRWFSDPRKRSDYFMTHTAINYHLGNVSFSRCLEIGPGPGTWTRILFRINPEAYFDLLDISQEMKKQFELEMRNVANIQYNIGDFIRHEFDDKYDLFFSSRAIEYFEDKKQFLMQVRNVTTSRANCCVIAKNPNLSTIFFKKSLSKQKFPHGGEISNQTMRQLLLACNFSDIEFYPVVIRIPIFDRFFPILREKLFTRLLGKKLGESAVFFFSESYLVKFRR